MPGTPAGDVQGAHRRGRPRAAANRHVYEDLLATCETLLVESGQHGISQKKLAVRAGTTEAMIQYYFGGKDGLLIALMERAVGRVQAGLAALEAELPSLPGNPTRHLVERLDALYHAETATTKLWLSEQAGRSAVTESYVSRLALKTHARIKRIIGMLTKAGVYAPGVPLDLIVFTLVSMIVAPIWQSAVLPARGLEETMQRPGAWVDYLTGLIDAQLRPAVTDASRRSPRSSGQ
jgi:AcrR family transcriptional regulator